MRTKKYRPRYINPDGALSTLSRMAYRKSGLDDSQSTDLGVANWLAFANMTTGESTDSDWNAVTGALNMGAVLSGRGIGKEYHPVFLNALDGAFNAKLRGESTGVWRYDTNYIQSIRQALELHDQQLKLISRAEMIDTILTVQRALDEGNVYSAIPLS